MKSDTVSRSLDSARYRLTREIRENPLLCVGIALGVGALIGALGSRAATSQPSAGRWLSDVASDLGSEADKWRTGAARAGRQAGKELHSALHHVTDSVPDVDIDKLVARGRHWLRSLLG